MTRRFKYIVYGEDSVLNLILCILEGKEAGLGSQERGGNGSEQGS